MDTTLLGSKVQHIPQKQGEEVVCSCGYVILSMAAGLVHLRQMGVIE